MKNEAYWVGYDPPALPEADRLKQVVAAARQLSPREVLRISIEAGIHNEDGTLTKRYR